MSAWRSCKNMIKRIPGAETAYRIWRDILREPLNRGQRSKLLARYARWHLWDKPRQRTTTVTLQNGMLSLVHPDSDSGEANIFTVNVDYNDNAFVRKHLEAGDFIIDAGCNVGNRTLVLADIIGGALLVDANPLCLGRARENIELNGLDPARFHFVAKAVGSCPGVVRFTGLGGTSTINRIPAPGETEVETVEVERSTLDLEWAALGRPPCTFLKLDLEGHDYDALLGARELLSSPDMRLVRFERLPGDELAKYQRLFDDIGWCLFTLEDRGLPTREAGALRNSRNLLAMPRSLLEETLD